MFLNLSQNYLNRGFWADEAWTSLISQLPFRQMLKTTARDFHPPAYYTIVGLVYKFFPPTEIVTRSISIIFYLLTVVLVYKLAAEIKDRTFGLLSALVVSFNPIFFHYNFEARSYTMLAFTITGSTFFLIKLLEKFQSKYLILFILFSTLGIYTHYYMFFTLFSQFLYIIFFHRKLIGNFLKSYIIMAILYLPWLPYLLEQVRSVNQGYWLGAINSKTHYEALLKILGGKLANPPRPFLFWFSIILLLYGAAIFVKNRDFKNQITLVWFLAIVPFVLATIPGLKVGSIHLPFSTIFYWRYLVPSAILFGVLIVYGASRLPKLLYSLTVVIILILSSLINFHTISYHPSSFKEVYEKKIAPEITPEDKIVTVPSSFAEVLYYKNRHHLKNDLIVLPEGLGQFSGKSLLDTYVENGIAKVAAAPSGHYFELRPGPNLEVKVINQLK